MTDLQQIAAAVGASSTATDPTLAAVYLAAARTVLDRLRAEVDSVTTLVHARETELARVAMQATNGRGIGPHDLLAGARVHAPEAKR